MDPSKLRREDFSYETNGRGYILMYRGQRIGGAGILHSAFGHSRKHTPKQVAEHSKYAEIAIQKILTGKAGLYIRLIDQINKE